MTAVDVNSNSYDAVIVGGGPAGATAGLVLARAGVRAVILEKSAGPRFHIGESMLPRQFNALKELGLVEKMRALPHVPKYGAEFCLPDGTSMRFWFDSGFCAEGSETFNIERSLYDDMLLRTAEEEGVEVRRGVSVKKVLKLADGDVAVAADDGTEVRGKYLLDASGQWTLLGRHLGTRKQLPDAHLNKTAYYGHFENVYRLPDKEEGHPTIVLCEEGWFWIIPLNKEVTSIGLVVDASVPKKIGVPANRMLNWAIAPCPVVRQRTAKAVFPDTNHVSANFSYTCKPYAGEGFFLLGDAAAFLDPIFSTGATMGIMSGRKAAELVIDVLKGKRTVGAARREYVRFFTSSAKPFWAMIRGYYRQPWRELFMNGRGPHEVHRAVFAVLAGHTFPRPAFKVWWRLKLFRFFAMLQRWFTLCPRHEPFSLLAQPEPAAEHQAVKEVVPAVTVAA